MVYKIIYIYIYRYIFCILKDPHLFFLMRFDEHGFWHDLASINMIRFFILKLVTLCEASLNLPNSNNSNTHS